MGFYCDIMCCVSPSTSVTVTSSHYSGSTFICCDARRSSFFTYSLTSSSIYSVRSYIIKFEQGSGDCILYHLKLLCEMPIGKNWLAYCSGYGILFCRKLLAKYSACEAG